MSKKREIDVSAEAGLIWKIAKRCEQVINCVDETLAT